MVIYGFIVELRSFEYFGIRSIILIETVAYISLIIILEFIIGKFPFPPLSYLIYIVVILLSSNILFLSVSLLTLNFVIPDVVDLFDGRLLFPKQLVIFLLSVLYN